MDAVEFIKENARMCKAIKCDDCPLYGVNNKREIYCSNFRDNYPEETVEIVEQWSKEHPRKTNYDKLKEVFGMECMKDFIWEDECCTGFDCPDNTKCEDCPYHHFWNREYKEPKGGESE